MTPSTLVEHVADWHSQLQIDRTNRTVRNVALTGGASKNGYRYSEQALQDAVRLYDRRPVFLDHAADKSRPQERSTRDLVGVIAKPRYESGRIRGDIRVFDTDSGRTFLALAESDAPGVGMSHVVLAERSQPDGTVDRIHDVVSVDAVVFPATTTTFQESLDSEESSQPSVEGRAANDTPAADAPARSDDLNLSLQQLLNERDELLAQLHAARQRTSIAQAEQTLTELLKESGLPDYALTETFRRQLADADDAARRDLLRERLQLIESARHRPPISCERATASGDLASDAAFVATLKRRGS